MLDFFTARKGRFIFVVTVLLFFAFFFWAQNVPNPVVPSFARISLISPSFFNATYNQYMLKNSLGPLRVLDDACVLIVAYALLTACWVPIHHAVGWYFVPIGQASLYVFVVHVFFIALVSDVLPFGFPLGNPHIWLNTLGHTFALASLWLMVRYQVLFRWIPR